MLAAVAMVSSPTADGVYGINSAIAIQVEFDAAVNVSGSPRLWLNSGGFATFTGTSGGGTIVNFSYLVRPGQNSADLDVRDSNSLVMGQITNVAGGGTANRTLPTIGRDEALSGFSDIRIDTTPPVTPTVSPLRINPTIDQTNPNYFLLHPDYFTVTGTAGTGPLEAGAVLSVSVNGATYNPSVSSTGVWRVDLRHDAPTSGVLGPWTTTSLTNYEVVASIRDTANNVSTDTTRNEITIDITGPSVASVTSPTPDGAYNAGDVIDIDVLFTEPVAVVGSPTLQLNATPANTFAVFQSVTGAGGNVVRFRYTVQPNDAASDLDYVFPSGQTTAILLNGGYFQDRAGNPATITMVTPGATNPGTLAFNKNIVVDTVAPVVTSVRAFSANGTYGPGADVFVDVTFDSPVIVSGPNPTLDLNASPTAIATYVPPPVNPQNPQTVLRFKYVVAQGDRTTDLDYRSPGALTLGGAGSSIQDVAGNNAVLLLPAPGSANSLGGQSAIVIASAPGVVSVTSNTADGTYTAGDVIDVRVRFDRAVTVTPTPTPFAPDVPSVRLNSGTNAFALYQSGSGTQTLVFQYVVNPGDVTAGDLDYFSTAALTTGGYQIVDTAAFNATPSTLIDAVIALPATGSSGIGSLDFNKNIRVVLDTTAPLAPSLTLGVGITDGATYQELLQTSGAVLVRGENNAAITVTFTAAGGATVVKNLTGTGSFQAVTLFDSDVVALGTGSVSVVARQTDRSGNQSVLSAPVSFTRVCVPPSLSLPASVANGGATLVEAASGVVTVGAAAGNTWDAILTGTRGTVTRLLSSGTNLQLSSAEVAALGDGIVSVSVTQTDPVGMVSTAATTSFTLDTVAPTVSIASSPSSLRANQTATITFTLSEASTNFTISSVTTPPPAVGSLSNFTGSGTTYTATFTPANGFNGNASISVAAGAFTDAAGNANLASLVTSIPVDTVSPTVSITSAPSSLRSGQTSLITFTLSEVPTDFTASDVTVSGGGLSNFAGSGTSYTATFTPDPSLEGNASISVAAGAFTDAVGNPNVAGSVSIPVDTIAPAVTSVTSATANGVYGVGAVIDISVQLSQAVVIANGTTATLALNVGRNALLNVASSTATVLRFSYTVQAGDTTADLDYTGSGALTVTTGSIRDAAGNDLVTTLPAPPATPRIGTPLAQGSLGQTKDIQIETSILVGSPGFSTTAPGPLVPYAVNTVPVVFSIPVTGFRASNLVLYLNNRPISIRGAVVAQANSTGWLVTLPVLSTNLRGNYRLDINGAGIVGSGGQLLTGTASIYWTRV
jgi:hypothetical protein